MRGHYHGNEKRNSETYFHVLYRCGYCNHNLDDFLVGKGIDSIIVPAPTALKYSILAIDIALLVIFLGRNTIHLVRKQFWYLNRIHQGV